MTTPTHNNNNFADLPFRNSEDFRQICDGIRKSMNRTADAIEFVARRVLVTLRRYEKAQMERAREAAKVNGGSRVEAWKIRANYGRAKLVAKALIKVAKLLRTCAKLADKAWKVFLTKYADDVMGNGANPFGHKPPSARSRRAA